MPEYGIILCSYCGEKGKKKNCTDCSTAEQRRNNKEEQDKLGFEKAHDLTTKISV